jgi:enamine deaminase RidA (YjgF/YER057c/UK114 family)
MPHEGWSRLVHNGLPAIAGSITLMGQLEWSSAMITERLDPESLHAIPGVAQVTVATGTKFIQVAGQTDLDPAGNLVGTTHRAQTTGALRNLHAALTAAGAEQADMTSMTWYVVDFNEEVLTELYLGSGDRAAETGEPPLPTALTLVGVSALWKPGLLVEISATAII